MTECVGDRLLPGPALGGLNKQACAGIDIPGTDQIGCEFEIRLVPRPTFNSGAPAEGGFLLGRESVLGMTDLVGAEEQLERLGGVVGVDSQPSEMPQVVPEAPDRLVSSSKAAIRSPRTSSLRRSG